MTPFNLNLILAQAPTAAAPTASDFLRGPLIPMLLMLGAVFFITQRSNSKRAKQHAQMIANLKVGDKVTTTSGIIGTIISTRENSLVLRSEETKLEVLKSTVADAVKRDADAAKA
ncbi:MAG: preprotein translocase subunit YajC [Verrucomicrobiota bacterium]|jgi:preprotein translocase subunit YajC